MFRFGFLIVICSFLGCSTDGINNEDTLESLLGEREIVLDNVIACAASNENDNLVSVFLYPRNGAVNIQYFETENNLVDKNDFNKYSFVDYSLFDIFNGYLKKFEVDAQAEKWVIVAFEEDGKTHLSNPIHLKHKSKPTEYLPQNISVDTSLNMPVFSWDDGLYDDSKIYFQIVSNAQDNLLSGTYTFERIFTYYELGNVVLNITKDTPPSLMNNTSYSFTLMSVSEDNWVNQFSVVDFELK
jgi:hypothetical protein